MIEEMLALLVDEGLKGVLVAPMLLGLETTRGLLADHRLVAIAHPSFSGAYYQHPANGIAKEVLLGTLFRLVGADASIFPNFGGRFSFSRQDCRAVRDRLRSPLGDLKPALPAPAGGMRLENLPAMVSDYGEDAIFLIGGALLGHSASLRRSTETFATAITQHFTETPAER